MAPILYSLELSPPVRAVLLTARALGIELELRNVDLFQEEHLKPEYLKMNPQHTIPTLDDNGFYLWDSHAIAAYLVGKYGKDDSLYPKDLQKRAIVDQRLHFDSGIIFTRSRDIFFPILFLGAKEIPQEKEDAVNQAYDFLESFLEGHDWLAGDQMTIADLCAIATISSIAVVVPVNPAKHSKLIAWWNRLKALPYYEEINGKRAEALGLKVNTNLGRA